MSLSLPTSPDESFRRAARSERASRARQCSVMTCKDCKLIVVFVTVVALATKPAHGLPEIVRIGKQTCLKLRLITWKFIANSVNDDLGGFFDGTDPMPESAFRQSLDRVNENGRFLPNSNLLASVERLPPNDSFLASKRGVCM